MSPLVLAYDASFKYLGCIYMGFGIINFIITPIFILKKKEYEHNSSFSVGCYTTYKLLKAKADKCFVYILSISARLLST